MYEQQWLQIRRAAHADAVCLLVAHGQPPYSARTSRSNVARALEHLLGLGVLEKKTRGVYTLTEPLFGRWMQERLSGA